MHRDQLARREFLALAGAGVALMTLSPFAAEATPASVLQAIEKAIGAKAFKEGKIALELPQIAENGSVVPLGVTVESPMTEKDFVKSVHLYADGNPLPEIADYHFGPHNGKAEFSLRIRLAKSQKIVAVAQLSNGDVYIARREVKVTIGGCGG
ncbi:MAG: thiosulfate oxidation carrier protein SoxY [Rhodospirillaceae bacterium]